MRYVLSTALLFCAAAGCADQQSTETAATTASEVAVSIAAINTNCPIMGSPVTDDGGRFDWNGKTVGFCCPECIEAFEGMSDAEKTESLAQADEGSDDHSDHDHGDHDHGEHGHDDAADTTES